MPLASPGVDDDASASEGSAHRIRRATGVAGLCQRRQCFGDLRKTAPGTASRPADPGGTVGGRRTGRATGVAGLCQRRQGFGDLRKTAPGTASEPADPGGRSSRFRRYGRFCLRYKSAPRFPPVTKRVGAWKLTFATAHPPADARPAPILGPCDQTPLDGIIVDVADFLGEFLIVAHIAIEAPAGLKKPRAAVGSGEASQDRRVEFTPSSDDPLGVCGLQPGERVTKRLIRPRPKEQVRVLGHQDPSDDLDPIDVHSVEQQAEEEGANPFVRKERKPTVTRERDEANLVRRFAAFQAFANRTVGCAMEHDGSL